MLTNEILKYPRNTEWTVINPHDENRRRYEDSIQSVKNNRVLSGVRVSDNRYAYTGRWSEDINAFNVTTGRSYGFLMKFLNNSTGKEYFAVVKPVNFVAPRAEYEEYWVEENERQRVARELAQAEQAKRQAIEEKRHAIRIERHKSAEPEAERVAESIRSSIRTLLGQVAQERTVVRVNVQGEWKNEYTEFEKYVVNQYGAVTLELRDFQRLLERALQD